MSMNGKFSLLKRCSLVAPALWALATIVVLHLNALIHVFSVNSKPTEHMASKVPNNGSPNNAIFCRTVHGYILPSLCPICLVFLHNNRSLLNQLFRCTTRALNWHFLCATYLRSPTQYIVFQTNHCISQQTIIK